MEAERRAVCKADVVGCLAVKRSEEFVLEAVAVVRGHAVFASVETETFG